jgi:hypothetical protein
MKYGTRLLGLAILMTSITAARATTENCAVVLNTPDGFLALREGPGTQFRIKDKLRPGQIITIPSEDCFWHRNGNVTCNKWTKVFVSDQAGPPLPFATGNFLGHGWVRSKYIQPSSSESGGC